MTDVEKIARNLCDTERSIVLTEGREPPISMSFGAAVGNPLFIETRDSKTGDFRFSLSRLGLAVRDHLLSEQGK